MAQVYGNPKLGLFDGGGFRDGTRGEFTLGTYNEEGLSFQKAHRKGSIRMTGGNGSTYITASYIPIDTSKTYQLLCYAKTRAVGTSGNTAGGHIGFACYDKNKTFIDLRNCGDTGNTTLSRAASPGDSVIYFTGSSGWYTGSDVTNNRAYFRQILFFPSTHPDYGTAHQYTRFNNRSYYRMEQTAQGDWAVYLESNTSSQTNTYTAATLPDYGYSLPAGTPVSRGVAGGTYNYALGAPNYPLNVWTRYATAPFTGENKNSGTPFRYATKFIRFLCLRNYNRRTESVQDHEWSLANILFTECHGGRDYRDIFPTTG